MPLPKKVSVRGERRVHVRENDENLIETRHFENRPDLFLQSSQDKLPAVRFDILHSFNQDRESRAVDVTDRRKIDHQALMFLLDHRPQGCSHPWGNVKVDFAFQRQNIGSLGQSHND